jgi:serine carboxypeptidase-like clade 1
LDKIRILIYSGDTDMAVPFNGNQAWIRNLKLPIISDWKPWRAYDLDGNVDMENIAGYRTIYQGLIFTTIKGTGHMVPQWKRKEAFYMVKQFLNNDDF